MVALSQTQDPRSYASADERADSLTDFRMMTLVGSANREGREMSLAKSTWSNNIHWRLLRLSPNRVKHTSWDQKHL